MNIDFIPSVKSSNSKLTASAETDAVSGKESTGEAGEGFFAKLSALFKGDEKGESKVKVQGETEVKSADVDKVASSKAESVDPELSAQETETEGEVVDEILTQKQGEAETSSNEEKSASQDEGQESKATKALASTSAVAVATQTEKTFVAKEIDAERVMGEGDQILHKLKQANQALAKSNPSRSEVTEHIQDGKDLPSEQPLADVKTVKATDAEQLTLSTEPKAISLVSESTDAEAELTNTAQNNRGADIRVEPSGELRMTQSVNALEDNVDPQQIVATSAGVLAMSQQGQPQELQTAASPTQNLDNIDQPPSAELDEQTLASVAASGQELSEEEQLALAAALVAAQQSVPQHKLAQPELAESAAKELAEDSLIAESELAAETVSPELISAQVQGEQAQPQGIGADQPQMAASLTSEQLLQTEAADDVSGKVMLEGESLKQPVHETKLARQIHQSIQQPLASAPPPATTAERLAAQNVLATPVNATDVAANSTAAASVVAPTVAAAVGTASLLNGFNSSSKANWSAAHLEAAGMAAQEADNSQQPRDSAFAQQLSSLSGLNGQHNQLNRVEQSQPQMPIMVNKEVAADQLSERVQMMLSKNLKNIDIRLDPPELGRMHIRMNMNGDAASVHFTVANQHVRDALEGSMPRLREMLAQQGVQLGETAVQHQGANQQQGYAAGGRAQSQSGSNVGNQMGLNDENFDSDVKLDLNVGAKRDGISYYA